MLCRTAVRLRSGRFWGVHCCPSSSAVVAETASGDRKVRTYRDLRPRETHARSRVRQSVVCPRHGRSACCPGSESRVAAGRPRWWECRLASNASGRRSAEAGCRSARRSYLPGRERSERSGRSRSRGVGRCRFVEDAVRSDATPARSRCWPEVRGGIAFARKLCAAGSLRSVPRPWSPLPSPGRSGRTFPGCPGQVSPAVTWLPASGSSGDSI